MAAHNDLGLQGEKLAITHLQQQQYCILETNWRFKRAEVDVIAKDGAVLVFVEVKTRSYNFFGEPEAFVSEKKEAFLFDAANAYMEQIAHDWEIRFDIVGIIIPKYGSPQVKHLKDAFFPDGW